MDKEFIFAKGIINIDGVEYGEFDLERIKERYEGKDKLDPCSNDNLTYHVYGRHKILDFHTIAFSLVYNKYTERIYGCTFIVMNSFDTVLRDMEELGMCDPLVVVDDESNIFVSYLLDEGKNVMVYYYKSTPSLSYVMLKWNDPLWNILRSILDSEEAD